jgi:hypothetical protein
LNFFLLKLSFHTWYIPHMFLTCFNRSWLVHLVFIFSIDLVRNKWTYLFSQIHLQGESWVVFGFLFIYRFWAKHICIMAIRRVRPMITVDNLDYIVCDVAFEGFVFNCYENLRKPIVVYVIFWLYEKNSSCLTHIAIESH